MIRAASVARAKRTFRRRRQRSVPGRRHPIEATESYDACGAWGVRSRRAARSRREMVSVRSAASSNQLLAGLGTIGIGVLLALLINVGSAQLSLVKVAFILGGFALLIPTMVLKEPKAYWLFLLVFTIPFDISKLLSAWLIEPGALVDMYGQPASGTTGVELYLTDIVLMAMLLPWLAQICLRQQKLYVPKLAYFFVCYLVWTVFVSLINARSSYLAIFELLRQTLYFLFFLYLINNLTTRPQFRSAIAAMFLGFAIGASTVIVFFQLGIGTESSIFARLHDVEVSNSKGHAYKPGATAAENDTLTLNDMKRRFGPAGHGDGSQIKRSQGMFRHPAIAANLCGLMLPIVLAYLVAARTNRDRLLLSVVFALGIAALALTFSRAGAIGFAAGMLAFLAVGAWSGLISRRVLIPSTIALAVAIVASIPLLLVYFGARPGSFLMRFYLFEAALQGYSEHPILGVGLNNATVAMKAGRQALIDSGIPMPKTESADSFYLVLLTEVGPLGFLLFFLFFGNIVRTALGAMREVLTDLTPLLVGLVAGLASLATQNLADDTLGGHAISATLWLFAGLMIAAARHIQAATQSSPAAGHAGSVARWSGPRPVSYSR
jgi:hypothetical protein